MERKNTHQDGLKEKEKQPAWMFLSTKFQISDTYKSRLAVRCVFFSSSASHDVNFIHLGSATIICLQWQKLHVAGQMWAQWSFWIHVCAATQAIVHNQGISVVPGWWNPQTRDCRETTESRPGVIQAQVFVIWEGAGPLDDLTCDSIRSSSFLPAQGFSIIPSSTFTWCHYAPSQEKEFWNIAFL